MNKVFASFLLPVPDYVSAIRDKETSNGDTDVPKPRKASLIHSRSPSLTGSSTPGTPRSGHSPPPSESGRATPKKTWLRNIIPSTPPSRESIDEPVEIPEKPAPTTAFARIWRMAQFTLPTTLQPSMAAAWTTCGVTSCPDRPDELPSMEWEKTMRIKGLGKVDINAYTAYVSFLVGTCDSERLTLGIQCACGSGLEFDAKFEELNPLATIQSVQLSMAELSIAGDGCAEPGKRDETWFSLFTIGNPDPDARITSTAEDARVWRGGVPASYDRLSGSAAISSSTSRLQRWKGKNRDRDRLEQPPSDTGPIYHPDLIEPTMTPLGDSFALKRQCRLPSPIVGIHSSTPTLLDPRISRVTHRLRVEVLFSVLGLDEHDNPLPLPKSKDKHSQSPAEGTTRRLWVEHAIPLRVCMLGPDSTITPTYDSLPANQAQAESFHDYLARIQIRKEPSAFTVPNNRGRIDLGEGSNDLRERTEEHIDDCQARCLCFYGDNAIYALIAKKDRVQPQEDQGGVKSTYQSRVGND